MLDELECLAPVVAARGDDDPHTTGSDKRVKEKHILSIDGVTIWLVHEMVWFPLSIDPETRPDVIVFGHTHQASLENHEGILQVNPGSPTFPNYRVEIGTVGLLSIKAGKAEAQIIQLQ